MTFKNNPQPQLCALRKTSPSFRQSLPPQAVPMLRTCLRNSTSLHSGRATPHCGDCLSRPSSLVVMYFLARYNLCTTKGRLYMRSFRPYPCGQGVGGRGPCNKKGSPSSRQRRLDGKRSSRQTEIPPALIARAMMSRASCDG